MDRAGCAAESAVRGLPRPLGVVGRRSRRLLAELSPIGTGCASAARPERSRTRRDAGGGVVSGCHAQLHRRSAAPCRGGRTGPHRDPSRGGGRHAQRSELGGPRRPGGKAGRGAPPDRRGARRPGGGLPAQHGPTRSWPSSPAPPSGPHGRSAPPTWARPRCWSASDRSSPRRSLTVSGYRFGRKWHDRRAEVAALIEGLPTLEHWITMDGAEGIAPGECRASRLGDAPVGPRPRRARDAALRPPALGGLIPPAPREAPSPSSTAMAAWFWNWRSWSVCIATWGQRTPSRGIPPPAGSCGTCSWAAF